MGEKSVIPHALKQANEDLLKSLARPSWNATDIERHITQFVHAFHHVIGGKEELSRRAHFVETQCASGSDFDKSHRVAMRFLAGKSVLTSQAPFAVKFLTGLNRPPVDAATVEHVAGAVGQLVRLTVDVPKPRAAFERWLRACNAVLLDAEHCQAEGCQVMLNVWECCCLSPTAEALWHKDIIFSDVGGWLLKKIKPAAESLLDWHRNRIERGPVLAKKQISRRSDQSDRASVADNKSRKVKSRFVGAKELAADLRVRPGQMKNFIRSLERKRLHLPPGCWEEIADPKPNSPRYRYLLESPLWEDIAAKYR